MQIINQNSIEALEEEVENICQNGSIKALEKIPIVGESITEKIEEPIKTGELECYGKLTKSSC